MSDLRKFAHSVQNHDKIIAEFRQGSDRKIRRRHLFTPTTSSFVSNGRLPLPEVNIMAVGTYTSVREERSWFSGAFRYHIPMQDDVVSKFQRYKSEAGKLLGARLTPDLIWELAPWSWATDWFANTGQIMTNISNLGSDGLVL
uniref:Uncharacterized protein n=1 Tax=Leviviridae sp. TaxID=2027243 RepID=A0A514D7S6_9VIRU|nr:MAG: hypothetical protein H1Rhizo251328_000004 [Leviviridae sp.]